MGFLGGLFGRKDEPSGMDEVRFWKIVSDVHAQAPADMDAKSEALKSQLSKLPAADALTFREIFDATMNRAYAWPLWEPPTSSTAAAATTRSWTFGRR